MVSVGEDLWLHDGHQAVLEKFRELVSRQKKQKLFFITVIVTFAEQYLLADAGVSGKNIGVLCNGKS